MCTHRCITYHLKMRTGSVMYLCYPVLFSAPSINVTILPDNTLQVMWLPADDINRSSISYVLTTRSADASMNISRNYTCPNATITVTGLSNVGTVSLQAKNPSALSESATVAYRMVNITGDGEGRCDDINIVVCLTACSDFNENMDNYVVIP